MTTGTARVNGAGLYFEVSGEGQPLMLLHDGLLDCRIWDDQFAAFSERYSAGEVLEMACEFFGPSRPFNPEEHPPSKRELWLDEDKEAFFFPLGTLVGEGRRE